MNNIITFGPQEMYKDVEMMVVHDNLGEGDEVIYLDLLTNINRNVIKIDSEQNNTEITIIEDDGM